MKKDVIYCAVILSLLVAVCILASRRPVSEVVQTVRVDTVFYERPQPVRISDKLRPIRVPKFLFAMAETDSASVIKVHTVSDSVDLAIADSVDLTIEHRTVEYADSNYRAVISGPALGDYGPQLDRFEVFPRTDCYAHSNRDKTSHVCHNGWSWCWVYPARTATYNRR